MESVLIKGVWWGGVGGRTFRKLSHLGGTKFFARKGRHKPEKKGVGGVVGEVATF